MKWLLTLSLIFSLKTWAYPEVGDFVRYEAQDQGKVVAIEKKVLSTSADNSSLEVRTLIIFDQEIRRDETHVFPKEFLFNPEKLGRLLKSCLGRHGALGEELIQDQWIRTCSFFNEDALMTSTMGDVPFGEVRFQIYLGEGEFLDFNLVQFRMGK